MVMRFNLLFLGSDRLFEFDNGMGEFQIFFSQRLSSFQISEDFLSSLDEVIVLLPEVLYLFSYHREEEVGLVHLEVARVPASDHACRAPRKLSLNSKNRSWRGSGSSCSRWPQSSPSGVSGKQNALSKILEFSLHCSSKH